MTREELFEIIEHFLLSEKPHKHKNCYVQNSIYNFISNNYKMYKTIGKIFLNKSDLTISDYKFYVILVF